MTADEIFFELAALAPGWDRARWVTFCSLSPHLQADMLANEQAQDWTTPGSSSWSRVLVLLGLLATIAVDISGIAGAESAVANLKL